MKTTIKKLRDVLDASRGKPPEGYVRRIWFVAVDDDRHGGGTHLKTIDVSPGEVQALLNVLEK